MTRTSLLFCIFVSIFVSIFVASCNSNKYKIDSCWRMKNLSNTINSEDLSIIKIVGFESGNYYVRTYDKDIADGSFHWLSVPQGLPMAKKTIEEIWTVQISCP